MKETVKNYLKHVAGLTNLIEWLYTHQQQGYQYQLNEHSVSLSSLFANKFILGVPKNKKWGSCAFIAAAHPEALFLQLLQIQKIAVVPTDGTIHFISPSIAAIEALQMPAIPAFVISLQLDNAQKTEILSYALGEALELRGFWFDESQSMRITSKASLWKKPLSTYSSQKELFASIEDLTHQDSVEALFQFPSLVPAT